MKTPTISLLSIFFSLIVHAQTNNLIPLQLWLQLPPQTNNGAVVNITNVNNYYITTNIYYVTVTNPPNTIVKMPNDIIDTRLGLRMMRVMSAPAFFTTDNFTPDANVTMYWRNPGRFQMNWPPNAVWFGNVPTNQSKGAVLVEAVDAEVWFTPTWIIP